MPRAVAITTHCIDRVLVSKLVKRRIVKITRYPNTFRIRKMEDEAIVERLTQIRGIGRWTAEMLLIFHLGRPDVLPADDYGVRKGFAIACDRELPSPKELAAYGARWKPYRTVASWYLWRVVERATARRVLPLAEEKPAAAR